MDALPAGLRHYSCPPPFAESPRPPPGRAGRGSGRKSEQPLRYTWLYNLGELQYREQSSDDETPRGRELQPMQPSLASIRESGGSSFLHGSSSGDAHLQLRGGGVGALPQAPLSPQALSTGGTGYSSQEWAARRSDVPAVHFSSEDWGAAGGALSHAPTAPFLSTEWAAQRPQLQTGELFSSSVRLFTGAEVEEAAFQP